MTATTRLKRPLFAILTFTVVFLYFEVQMQQWFLKLMHGYLIKLWLPPFILFWCLVIKKLMTGTFGLKVSLKMDPALVFSLLAYSFFGFLAMTLNESPPFIIKYFLIIINPVILFALITENFRDNEDLEHFLKIFFVCGVLQALYSFLKIQSWIAAGMPAVEGVVTNAGLIAGGDVSTSKYWSPLADNTFLRLTDPSFEHGKFGAILSPLAFLGIYHGLHSAGWRRYLYFGASLFILTMVMGTLSRSTILAVVIGLFVFFHFVSKYKYRMSKKKILLVLLLPATVSLFLNAKVWLRFIEPLVSSIESLSDLSYVADLVERYDKQRWMKIKDPHIVSLENTFSTFIESPFLGVGYTNFHGNSHEDALGGQYPELNRYLIILATSGLFTLIPYVFFIFSLIRINYRTILTLYEKHRRELTLGFVFLACNCMFAVKLINSGEESLYYWAFFAFSAAWIRNCSVALASPPS